MKIGLLGTGFGVAHATSPDCVNDPVVDMFSGSVFVDVDLLSGRRYSLPRFIPEHVMRQLEDEDNLARLRPPFRPLVVRVGANLERRYAAYTWHAAELGIPAPRGRDGVRPTRRRQHQTRLTLVEDMSTTSELLPHRGIRESDQENGPV